MNEQAVGISVEKFWELVGRADWANRQAEPLDQIRAEMMRALSPAEAEAMYDTFLELKADLAVAIEAYEAATGTSAGVGDDGFDDLTSHIVGLGREEYERNLASPSLAVERGQRYDFRESFAYVVPGKGDYAYLSVERYREWAVALQADYAAVGRRVSDLKSGEAIEQAAGDMVEILTLMAQGDWRAFLAHEEKGRALAVRITNLAAPLFRHARIVDGGDVLANHWGLSNLFTEVGTWLRDYPGHAAG
jgi:hypothetical protein